MATPQPAPSNFPASLPDEIDREVGEWLALMGWPASVDAPRWFPDTYQPLAAPHRPPPGPGEISVI